MSGPRLLFSSFLVILWVTLVAVPAQAFQVDLYLGEAAISNAAEAGAGSELRALDEVLQRLTGELNQSLVAQLGIQASDLRGLVLSRQVVQRRLSSVTGEPQTVLRHQVSFDAEAIHRLLRDRGVPVWGRERPALLLWLAVEDAQGVRMVTEGALTPWLNELERRYGLVLIQPLADAEDLAQIGVTDIRGGFIEATDASAQRYGAGVAVMLDLRQLDDRWVARLLWRSGGQDFSRVFPAISEAVALDQALAILLQSLAETYAQLDDGVSDGERLLRVRGVREQLHYREVMAHLTQLSAVESVRLVAAEGDVIELVVRVRGTRFEQLLALGGVLVIESESADGSLQLRLM